MDLQDPEVDLPDYEEGTAKATRLRKLAELLRKQNVAPPSAAGTMVSGHYIAPSTSAMLAPAAQELRALMADRQAQTQEAQNRQAKQTAMQQFTDSMPQPTPGHDIPGPVTPEMAPLGQTDAVPVTRNQVLKQTLRGMQNPATAAMAKVYGDTATKGIDAEDTRQFKSEENLATRQARADDQEANRQNQMALMREKIASAEKLGQDSNVLKQMLGQMQADSSRYASDARVNAAGIRAAATANKPNQQVDNKIEDNVLSLSKRLDQLQPTREAAQNVQNIIDGATDPTTGKVKNIPGFGYGALKPTWLQNSAEAKNSAAIQAWANAVIRSQAGLSQTLSETQNQVLESLARGKGRQDQFLAVYPQVMEKLNATLDSTEAGHRPEAVERYLDRGGNLSRVYSKYDKKGQQAEADRAARRGVQSGRSAPTEKTADDYLKMYNP